MKDYGVLINEKRDLIDQLMSQVFELRKEIVEIKCKQEYSKNGLMVGDTVENASGEKGILSRFDGCSWHWFKLKKDGTPSKKETYIFNFNNRSIKDVTP